MPMRRPTSLHAGAILGDRREADVRRAVCGLGVVAVGMFASLALAAKDPAASVVFVQEGYETGPTSSSVSAHTPSPDLRLTNPFVSAGGVAGVVAYGFAKWWDQGFKGQFSTGNEGWFGQDTRYGGADKLGHAYSANAGVRLMSALLQSYGDASANAAKLAFWST